ncbi:vacuolar-sorting receptor 6-like [Dorcoceras hygrometricum]|uniref:Vacuolar-sorting receptor 6-like n=1 Tax=Dorcoceras hygrometricum TaxID=472368 RepID=A0A2Z7CVE4_9LAMI|nr:vacuolar-sorting receptor 6-like [Dorcoceras hygrometricum]
MRCAREGAALQAAAIGRKRFLLMRSEILQVRYNLAIHIDQIRETLALIPLLGIRIRPPAMAAEEHKTGAERRSIRKQQFIIIAVDYRQSGPRPDPRLLRQAALEALTRSARTNTPRKTRPEQFPVKLVGGGGGGGRS